MNILCRRCKREIGRTKTDHTRAHRCPHGLWCQPPYVARRRGIRREPCTACDAPVQGDLFAKP